MWFVQALVGAVLMTATSTTATVSYGSWSSCNATCGLGNRTRTMRVGSYEVPEIRKCIVEDCTAGWGSCTESCGGGTRSRSGKPPLQIKCNQHPCTKLPSCGQLDIVLVVDASPSVGSNNWWIMKQFATDLVSGLPKVTGSHRVGMVSFATEVRTNFRLNTHSSIISVQDSIWKAAYLGAMGGYTNTGGAITAGNALFSRSSGDRVGAKNIMIVFTDGRSQKRDVTKQAADAARRSGTSVFAVGISGSAHVPELINIGGHKSRVITASSYLNLGSKLRQITASTCVDDYKYDCCLSGGDPHIRTFDGAWFHFQGLCKYTMAKVNTSSSGFNVVMKHEPREGRTDVSYLQYVEVSSGGRIVRIDKNKVFKVDGAEVSASSYRDTTSGISATLVGNFVVVTLRNGVTVSYDGYWISYVCVPKTFKGEVKGICGNFDGSSINDYVTKNGATQQANTAGYNAVCNSWKVPEDSSCPDSTSEPSCTNERRVKAQGSDYCHPLRDTKGILASCIKETPYDGYFKSCVYDTCVAKTEAAMKAIRCRYLEAMAWECEHIVKNVTSWATATGCDKGIKHCDSWGACSVTCGIGTQTRTCKCLYPAPGKATCDKVVTSRTCTAPTCAPAGWSAWTKWTPPCKCGITLQRRTRQCNNAPGQPGCEGPSSEDHLCTKTCTTQAPQTADCKRCDYGDQNVAYLADPNNKKCFYQCEKKGKSYRRHHHCCAFGTSWDQEKWNCVKTPCDWTGKRGAQSNCAGYIQCVNRHELFTCCNSGHYWDGSACVRNNGECRDNCPVWDAWAAWGICSGACGQSGTRLRYRSCRGGTNCVGKNEDQQRCRNKPCKGCVHGQSYEDTTNCAAYKICDHDKLVSMCCPKGTFWSKGGCKNKAQGSCTDKCGKSTPGGCGSDMLVHIPCPGIKNQCSKCTAVSQGVKAQGPDCNFNIWSNPKPRLEFHCFNNRYNGKNVKHFTIMTWFKTTLWAWGARRVQGIARYGECGGPSVIDIYLQEGTGGYWNLKAEFNGRPVGTRQVKTNSRYHMALVHTGVSVCLTVRASGKTNATPNCIPLKDPVQNAKCPLIVGQKGTGNHFHGLLDEFRVYERTFTTAEINALASPTP